jgi:hypothetical protein
MGAPLRKMIMAGLALCVSTPAWSDEGSKATVYWKSDHWTVLRDEGVSCTALKGVVRVSSGTEMAFAVSYDAKDPYVALMFITPEPTSLPKEGEAKLQLTFLNNDGKSTDDGWGSRDFSYEKVASGYLFNGMFTGRENTEQLLGDIARGSHVVLMTERNVPIVASPLDGSAAMVEKLRACSIGLFGLNPDDPFLK